MRRSTNEPVKAGSCSDAWLGLDQPHEFGPDLIQPALIRLSLRLHHWGDFRWTLHSRFQQLLDFQIKHFLDKLDDSFGRHGFVMLR